MFRFDSSPATTAAPELIFERLEERIVLDGSVEASSGPWSGPTPGSGIFDGGVHRIEDVSYVFLEGIGAGLGIGYWWNPGIGAFGWAFDYETGWWWENRGLGWDWMNVGWWDFESYANAGVCVFDGQARSDFHGVEFQYDQTGDEMVYTIDGASSMKYELGSETDSGWGWQWWDSSSGQDAWVEWEDGSGDPYALPTNSYSGFSAEFLYDGAWRSMPGGHGEDWVAFNSMGAGLGGVYWLWCDSGTDLKIDYTADASATPVAWDGAAISGSSENWNYIGECMFTFESAGAGSVDRQWTIYDGSESRNGVWFTYEVYDYSGSDTLGAWDFNGLQAAFLSDQASGDGGPYSANQQYLKQNVISVTGSTYDNAGLTEIVAMMEAISQSHGYQFFETVMFHEQAADTGANSFTIGNSTIGAGNVASYQSAFGDMAGLMLGDGTVGQVHLMNSDAASNFKLQGALNAIQGYFNGHGPWGSANSPVLRASYDASGDCLSGSSEADRNWRLEWSSTGFDTPNPYDNALAQSDMLYGDTYTAAWATQLNGDAHNDAEAWADSRVEYYTLYYCNVERTDRGLPALIPNANVDYIADTQADNVADTGVFAHNSSSFPAGWQTVDDRFGQIGWTGWGDGQRGENLFAIFYSSVGDYNWTGMSDSQLRDIADMCVYNWVYDDAAHGWGHRNVILNMDGWHVYYCGVGASRGVIVMNYSENDL